MHIQPSDWGIALVVAGSSSIGGFIGGILATIAVEIEKVENTYVDKFVLAHRLRKMFLSRYIVFLFGSCIVILFGFYLLNIS